MDWGEQKLQNINDHSCAEKIHRWINEQTFHQRKLQSTEAKIWGLNNERLHKFALEMETNKYWSSVLWKVHKDIQSKLITSYLIKVTE